MPGIYRNIVTGVTEERPTTAEIVRARFSDISGGDRTLLAPGDAGQIALLDKERERSRELLVPLILECLDQLDAQWPQDTMGAIPIADIPEMYMTIDDDDREALETAPMSIEELMGRLRAGMYQLLLSHASGFISESITRRDPRLIELAQRRVTFLRHFHRGQQQHGAHRAVVELFASGFGTANDMAWDIARGIPMAHMLQNGSGIGGEAHAKLVERSQTICEPLASMHQHDFVPLVERIKRGRSAPKITSSYEEVAFADPRYFWLNGNGGEAQVNAELAESAFPMVLSPNMIKGFTCPGKGKGIHRILLRTAALCRRFVEPRMAEINEETARDIEAHGTESR